MVAHGCRGRAHAHLLVCIGLIFSAGCFRSPDVAKIVCISDDNCPNDYTCVLSQSNPQHGKCVPSSAHLDAGGTETASSAETSEAVDRGMDGASQGIDQGSAEGPDAWQVLDAPIETSSVDVATFADVEIALDSPSDSPEQDTGGPDQPMPGRDAGDDTALACSSGCCKDSDCPGLCQTCSTDHTCVAIINADDPTGRCAGICDSTGACKSKNGQSCQTASGGCVAGTTCSPDGICCNEACTSPCMACDIAGFIGTCTVVAFGNPHGNRTSCSGADSACAGACAGRADGQCSYPSNACGTASCTGTTYQPAGTCSSGTCNVPAAQPCPSGETCSSNACTCASPNTSCPGGCVSTQSDPKNCGSCGHDCLGGQCTAGQCGPAYVTQSLGLYSYVFGVDSQYVYYSNCSEYYKCNVFRVEKTATGAIGSALSSVICLGIGVIGNTLLLFQNQGNAFVCDIGTTCDPSDTTKQLQRWVLFKSPSPPYIASIDVSGSTGSISWYSTSLVRQSLFNWSLQASFTTNYVSNSNSAFWTQDNTDGLGNPIGTGLYGQMGYSATTVRQLASWPTQSLSVVDANEVSILLHDTSTKYLYRVSLPGPSTQAPAQIVGSNATRVATEDASGIYWMDAVGTLFRCAAPNCATSTTLATAQAMGNSVRSDFGTVNGLYQDASALYWVNTQGQLVRLAK